jgi:CO/xanthine dehydrogenase Mo-binding subunit
MAESWIGRSIPRVGGVERVTGAQRYAADIRLENVLHVKLVHLDCARARIDRLDVSKAAAIDGVRCILTAADLPDPMPRFGPAYKDRPVLAIGETKFFGEPVAAVAAETEDAARAAAAAVRVDYEALPAVLTVEQALEPGAPLVQDPAIRVEKDLAQSNVLHEWRFGWGDVGAHADCIIENDYTFPMVTHFSIEPHAFLAAPDAEGITIWSAIQHPYVLQRVVASALGWPVAKVRIVSPDPGGGFGGKGWPKFEPLLAFLALRTGRPVRLVLTLEETFQQVRRASAKTHARTGFDRDGRIVFQDLHADFLIGAYADVGGRVVSKASYAACGPYRTPNARVMARALLSHTTPSTAFRGFGTPQASWAVESQLNAAAAALGIDRLEIRRRNVAKRDEAFIPGDTPSDGDWDSVLLQAGDAIGWSEPLARNRGRGISLGLKSSSTASASYAIARLHYDGSASILSGTSDMGQGARTVLKQIAAEELGIAPERIAMVMGDTAVVPFDSSTSASRSTVFMGNAVAKACRDVKQKLKQMAAQTFSTEQSDIRVADGLVRIPGREMTYEELLHAHFGPPRGEVIGIGQEGNAYDAAHPLGGRPAFWELMCAAAEVEVDPDVGMVQIVKLILVSDIGKALNPQQVEAQDEGAAVMGLGHSFMEQLLLDARGRIRNLGALDYRIPTIQDTAEVLHSILVENADGPGPHGAKGAGEGGILAIAAAVGAAVNEAAGIELRELPMTPERVWRAVREKATMADRRAAGAPRQSGAGHGAPASDGDGRSGGAKPPG